MNARNRVAITSLGVLASNGTGVDAFWRTILEGRSGVAPITSFDATGLPCRIAGEVKDFEPRRYIDPLLKPERRMGRASQLGIAAARMAFDGAGFRESDLAEAGEIPVVMGVSSSALELREKPASAWIAIQSIPHIVGSGIVHCLNLKARLLTVSTGCASGLDAVATAAAQIAEGRADVAIAGAADSVMSRFVFECFARSRKLSSRNDDPAHASRPFDRDRDGGVAAEGAGVIVMEHVDFARARGATPIAEILGYGMSTDRVSEEEGAGMQRAMALALANSCLLPEQIDHISAHGPSDVHMDRIETAMIKRVFGPLAYRIPVSSIKAVTGNPMGVGCMHQIIAGALSLRDQIVPPTANWENADPACDLDCVPNRPRRQPLERILVNTHGFGHGNSSLVMQRSGRGDGGRAR